LKKADWYYPMAGYSSIAKAWAPLLLKRTFMAEKPDVVHASWVPTYPFLAYLSKIKPLVSEVLGSDVILDHLLNPLMRSLVIKTLSYSNAVIVPAEHVKRKVLSYKVDNNKVFCIPVGVDTSKFYHNEENRRRIRSSMRIDDDTILIICTRWHAPIYGIENIIRAIPKLTHKRIIFLFVGTGPLLNYHKTLAKDLGLLPKITFMKSLPNNELPKYLSAADVYISSSYSDGASISLLEAMACELPVIVTDISGNREWVSDGQHGLLIKKSDPSLVAERIRDMILLKSEWKRIGLRNRGIIENRGNINKLSLGLLNVYRFASESKKGS
jgi:glycosyltransferase involved in cell wall biosynthesis